MSKLTTLRQLLTLVKASSISPESYGDSTDWFDEDGLRRDKLEMLSKLIDAAVIGGDNFVDSFFLDSKNATDHTRPRDLSSDPRWISWNRLQKEFDARSDPYTKNQTVREFHAEITHEYRRHLHRLDPSLTGNTHCPGRDFKLMDACYESLKKGLRCNTAWPSKRRLDEVLGHYAKTNSKNIEKVNARDVYRYYEQEIEHTANWEQEDKVPLIGRYYCVRMAYKNAGLINVSTIDIKLDNQGNALSYTGIRNDREGRYPYQHNGYVLKVAHRSIKLIGHAKQTDMITGDQVNSDDHIFESALLDLDPTKVAGFDIRAGIYSGLNENRQPFSAKMILIKEPVNPRRKAARPLAFTATQDEFLGIDSEKNSKDAVVSMNTFIRHGLTRGVLGGKMQSLPPEDVLKMIKNKTGNKYRALIGSIK